MKRTNLTAQISEKQEVEYFITRPQLERILSLLGQAKFASSKLDDALSDQDFSKALVQLGVMEDSLDETETIYRAIQFNQEIKREAATR